MRIYLFAMILAILICAHCSKDGIVTTGGAPVEDVLIKSSFIDDNSYIIVCKGYPAEGLDEVARVESARRAALLNAYYFTKLVFDDSVAPDRDGRAEKFVMTGDYAIIHYIISKKRLRDRMR